MRYLIILTLFASCYPNPIPDLYSHVQMHLDERTCNLIVNGDCGTFESDMDGISAGPTWSIARLDTPVYEGSWAVQGALTIVTPHDTILFQDDSIQVDSNCTYDIMAYLYVDECVVENFPIIGVSYEPLGNDSMFINDFWVGEEGFDHWVRIRLNFSPLTSKKIRCHVYALNMNPITIVYIDKFKLMNSAINNPSKCCTIIPD